MAKKITEILVHQKAKLIKIDNTSIAQKLFTMGMLPNSIVRVERKTVNGSTFFISIYQNQNIAIRKKEAEHILVEEIL